MVGFTTFSERSGEEAAFTLMRSFAKLMDEAVRGAASRANDEVRQEAAATGELPLAYMLRIMRDPS